MAKLRVGRAADFDEGTRAIVDIGNAEVAVFKVGGEFFAVENTCLHAGGPVGEGITIGKVCAVLDDAKRLIREEFSSEEMQIVCPWHGWAYDVKTGEFAGDKSLRLRTFDTGIHDGEVFVYTENGSMNE